MHAPECSVAQFCLTLRDSMDCSQPGSCYPGIFPARILEGVATSSFRGSSKPQGSNQHILNLLHWQADSLPLSHKGISHYMPMPFKIWGSSHLILYSIFTSFLVFVGLLQPDPGSACPVLGCELSQSQPHCTTHHCCCCCCC